VNHGLRRFHEDLERLGLRPRRQHDTRRTFISIARADGARPDILRWATHGPTGDVVDVYTTLPWATLCEEVAKARIELLEGKLIELPVRPAMGVRGPLERVRGAVTDASTSQESLVTELVTATEPLRVTTEIKRGGRDSNPPGGLQITQSRRGLAIMSLGSAGGISRRFCLVPA
jgi:hypothetical protein